MQIVCLLQKLSHEKKRKEKKYNKNDEAFEYFSTMHIQNHCPQQNSHIVR